MLVKTGHVNVRAIDTVDIIIVVFLIFLADVIQPETGFLHFHVYQT